MRGGRLTDMDVSAHQIELLVEMSDLFIFASSVIKFVDDPSRSPDGQVKAVLSDE